MRHLCILGVEVPQCHMSAIGETSSLKSVKEGKYLISNKVIYKKQLGALNDKNDPYQKRDRNMQKCIINQYVKEIRI